MSHFYADIQGSRGEATRCGTKDSGINGHIRGWSVGCRVNVYHDEEKGDVVEISSTGGSNNSRGSVICYLYEDGSIKYADDRLNLLNKTNEIVDNHEFEQALREDGLIQ